MAKPVKKTPVKKKSPALKRGRFSHKGLWVFIVSFAVIGGLLLILTKAAPPPSSPSIYLTPDAQAVNVGDTFTVNVYEDSGTDSVNVVQANLTYDTSLLSYTGHTDSSVFPLVAENPGGDTGSLRFARGTCGGCTPLSGSQLVVSLTFKALAAGTASVNFDSGTLVARSADGTAEPNLSEAGGTYTIAGTTTPPPPPSGGGGGTTTPPPSSPPASSTPVTHKTTTSSHPVTTAPTSPATAQPVTASNDQTTAAPSTSSAETPLIAASTVHLLKISGVAFVLAIATTLFLWALSRMRSHLHLHLAPQHNFSGGAAALPMSPPAQPVVILNPTSQNRPPATSAKPAPSADGPGKPQPGTVLQPNSNKKT
jgi:hypothetical protein